MWYQQNQDEEPDDLFELVLEETVTEGMLDQVLKRGISEMFEQCHLSG